LHSRATELLSREPPYLLAGPISDPDEHGHIHGVADKEQAQRSERQAALGQDTRLEQVSDEQACFARNESDDLRSEAEANGVQNTSGPLVLSPNL
jgi:hypothetical protein